VEASDRRDQQIAIVGEILDGLERAPENHDGHRVAGRHLRAEEFDAGIDGANLLGRLHRGKIKKYDDEPSILKLDFRICSGSGGLRRGWRGGSIFELWGGRGQGRACQMLKVATQ